jgi:alkaline phosphatase
VQKSSQMRALRITFLSFLFISLFTTCLSIQAQERADGEYPKYLFLFIGDGMGIGQINATEAYLSAVNGEIGYERLAFSQFPVTGMIYTNASDRLITGSAASGTALATGNITGIGRISMDEEGKEPFETIAEKAKKKGMKVGIISSVSIDHATPAVFYAHQQNRNQYFDIAVDLANSSFDLFAGGGFREPVGAMDGSDINIADVAIEKGFTFIRDNEQFLNLTSKNQRVLFQSARLADGAAMPYRIDQQPGDITLAQITEKAIELLGNDNGFFIMVEGGKIDWACHANDAATTVHEVLDFDEAVAKAYDFYLEHPDETLIIVTADHETGGMAVGADKTGYDVNLESLKYQRYSLEQLQANLADLRGKWQGDMEAGTRMFVSLLENDYGLGHGKRIELGEAEKSRLLALWQQSLQAEGSEKEGYGGNDPVAKEIIMMMSEIAGVGWTSGSHTAGTVPVFAIGKGAENFSGMMQHTEIPKRMETHSVIGVGKMVEETKQ